KPAKKSEAEVGAQLERVTDGDRSEGQENAEPVRPPGPAVMESVVAVPLDERRVTEPRGPDDGGERSLPALHPHRMEKRSFVAYRPPRANGSPALVEEFLEHAQMATHKESKVGAPRPRFSLHGNDTENFFTPTVFGEIIYNNFLFDIPKILDLCVLFGKGNSQLLHKMIENIFIQQPSYYSDLDEAVSTIMQVLNTILERCGLQQEGAAANEPLKLEARATATAMTMSQEDLVDLVLYLCDTCSTIYSFLDIFPAACATFQSHGFLSRLVSFYEMVVPDMEKAVRKRNFDDKSLQEDLWRRVSHSRRKMVEIVHLLLQHTCLQPILEGSENIQTFVEDFLQILTIFLQEKRFLADYDEQFPVADDISLLQQAFPLLDETRTSYLLQGVESAWETVGRTPPRLAPLNKAAPRDWTGGGQTQAEREPNPVEELQKGAVAPVDTPQREDNGPLCTLSTGEMESLLSHIKDLLPDLGEGFLLACLQEYGYNSEVVINNILEDRLTSALAEMDRSLPRPPKEELPPVLSSRSNVFDDDEFDVFHRDNVDMSRVWRGKKQAESVRATLDDKRHIEEQRGRYQAYDTVVDEVLVAAGAKIGGEAGAAYAADDYDDEYDDTYDVNQVGANDLDEDSDLLNRRPFTIPQVLRSGRQAQDKEESEEDEEEEENKDDGVKKDHFVQDPAVLRERAEARRAAMQSRRGYRPEPVSNVMGRPKGQGQTQDTVVERRRKEANKSRNANHSRRVMADRKRNKGMIPS
ncbi:hypothetical protein Z043_106483, partial [Scleropages formosus]